MTANPFDTKAVMREVLQENLEKLAVIHADKKNRLKRIRSLQSLLAADVVDDKALGQTMIAIQNRFKRKISA